MKDHDKQNGNAYPPVQGSNLAEHSNPVNLRFLFNKYILRHWYLYVYTLTIAMITAYFYNWYATPIYFTSSTVLIKDDKQKYNGNDLLSQLNEFNSEGGIENEIGIIRSRTLIYKALQELDFEKMYLLKGDIKTSELFSETPIRLVDDTLYPAAFNTSMQINVVDDRKYKLTYHHPTGEYVGYYLFGKTVHTKLGVFSIIKTDRFIDSSYANPAFEKRNLSIRLRPLNALTDQYQTGLKVDKISKQASLLQISVQGAVPQKNEAFLNKLCNLYIQKGIEVKNEYAVNTLRFIDEQLQILTRDIDVNEANVEDFRVKRGITDLNIEATSYLDAVKNFDAKISETQVQLSFLDYLERYVSGGKELTGNLSPASILVNDPLLQNLVIKLNELENRRKAQLNLAKSENPLLIGLNIEIQNTRGALKENIKSIRNGLKASLDEALMQKDMVQGKMRLLPGAQRELQSLLRGSNIKETLYSYLLQKRAETAILLASTTADNRIIDVARTFEKPLKPIKSLSYSIAVILGLLIPAVIIYSRDMFNDKLNDRYDLERQTSIPILGMIGLSASKSSLVVTEKPNSHISEAFRSIRTNLQYFNPDKRQNVIMITSSISGEGKSFCSVNLAVMLALSGRKTILVGCDLRKPKITVGFDFISDTGLSNYLIGIASEKEIIQNTGAIPNLDVILSGPKPPNPSELIISPRMDEMFKYLKANYDNIILDTPPIGLITDAMVLSKYTDINIYVVRQGVTRRHHLNFINKLYLEGKIPNLCIIMNAMKAGNRSYGYGYEYAYGYGYGYGYGYYEEDRSEKGLKGVFRNVFKSKSKKT
jgi:capsular exopolysaccharide synthesis family protein